MVDRHNWLGVVGVFVEGQMDVDAQDIEACGNNIQDTTETEKGPPKKHHHKDGCCPVCHAPPGEEG